MKLVVGNMRIEESTIKANSTIKDFTDRRCARCGCSMYDEPAGAIECRYCKEMR